MQKSICREIVKRHDYSRYLISLFAKSAEMQRGLWALYAFNYEIAKTREIVTDTTLGLIRLTWWRDALKSIYGMPTEHIRRLDDHPILPELAQAIKRFELSYELFDKLLLGREFDLEDVQPETLDGLRSYLDNTNMHLLKLTASVCKNDIPHNNLERLSTAIGLTGLIRAIPFHAQHQIVMLPTNLISRSAVINADENKLKAAVGRLIEVAQGNLSQLDALPKGPFRALKKLAQIEIKQITKNKNLPYDHKGQVDIPFLAFKLVF